MCIRDRGSATRSDIAITDPDFKYPSLWKSNIAADYKFGDGWDVSRDQKNALSECWRVLKKEGFLLLSDLDTGNLLEMAEQTGFTILRQEDQALLWREYYLEAIWNDSFCCEEYKLLQKEYKGKKLRYTMLVGRKE